MPYIDKERRTDLTVGDRPETPGELNFTICALVDTYVRREVELDRSEYSILNEAYGAMLAAAAEFYRRVLVPFEEKKKKANGEVFLCVADLDL